MNFEEALGIVRMLIETGIPRESAINNPAVPVEFRSEIENRLRGEEIIVLEPADEISSSVQSDEWLNKIDRSNWYYWPTLRGYFLSVKKFPLYTVRSIDESTDRILGRMPNPSTSRFDVRGLVLGYVQSGKTANYTALIAKAADVGYRLIVVLSGIDNGLRRQTQIRLKKELVGYADHQKAKSVPLPPLGRQWHEFTTEDIDGDFRPGFASPAALQGSQPVLLVIKKNGTVLRRLLNWLDNAPEEVKHTIPLLVIDDEADQASIDTRGTYIHGETPLPDDYEPPSVINSLIRQLLNKFHRSSYVAYTATPFANILIPHDANDPEYKNDLFPKNFIFALPKPHGYFGAEELFGISNSDEEEPRGLDIVREVSPDDLQNLEQNQLPVSLKNAIIDFILAGAVRAARGEPEKPATMLVHISRLIAEQNNLAEIIGQYLQELRDEWRYFRNNGILEQLRSRWEHEFRPVTKNICPDRDMDFEKIEPYIGHFFESVKLKIINSATGDVLDYEREPQLKAIAIGGDRLSRGLTLEGLLVSYFVRRTPMYDTLMQMGRWFGFRSGFEDITRIYTTAELAGWFSDLAVVENQLRDDIKIYENLGLTPYEVGTRILLHPSLQVTSPLKMKYTRQITIRQSFSGEKIQTFKFPLNHPDKLVLQEENNLKGIRKFLLQLGNPAAISDRKGPIWTNVPADLILECLRSFCVDIESGMFTPDLICKYIEQQNEKCELLRWTVAIRGRELPDPVLGDVDWGIPGMTVHQISRTRLGNTENLGVITSPGDEAIGLSDSSRLIMQQLLNEGYKQDPAARRARPPEEALLLIYPISKYSGHERRSSGGNRRPLYDDPNQPHARNLIGLAISFPHSNNVQPVTAYLTGTAGWRLSIDQD
ncbi:MAG TPA: Z1 domain-containing protein [Bacteroidales bacterium]|jgi:hypothetical protein|nr:Z1 domain-containing protein [Bacteroidales bacterium]